ncbi:hypothetical protein MMC12_004948 [Toensbergia leucococca]|nr:hypothetical protein [Toensbergia leucococca]
MDPASAGVAVVGFTSAVVTLAGLAVQSCQTLHALHDKLKHTKVDVEGLINKLETLGNLLNLLGNAIVDEDDVAADIKAVWAKCSIDVERDLTSFSRLVNKLETRLNDPSVSGLDLRLRVKKLISDDVITDHMNRLGEHIQSLGLIQNSIIRPVTHVHSTRTLSTSIAVNENLRQTQDTSTEVTNLRQIS